MNRASYAIGAKRLGTVPVQAGAGPHVLAYLHSLDVLRGRLYILENVDSRGRLYDDEGGGGTTGASLVYGLKGPLASANGL